MSTASSQPPSAAGLPADFNRVLAAAARVQTRLPPAVVVGGTAAAIHARHRISYDADHCISDLTPRFNAVRETLEHDPGWTTARVNPGKVILGSQDGVEQGVRNLIRRVPLEAQEFRGDFGVVSIPTAAESLRIKGWLALKRGTTRDYLDVAALWRTMGPERGAEAFKHFDNFYQTGTQESALKQVITRLADPAPADLGALNLSSYKGLDPQYHDWNSVRRTCQEASVTIFDALPSKPAISAECP